jgi:hypothetical protein
MIKYFLTNRLIGTVPIKRGLPEKGITDSGGKALINPGAY